MSACVPICSSRATGDGRTREWASARTGRCESETAERRFVHPRDPYTRVDVLRSSRRVRILVGGTVIADSTRSRTEPSHDGEAVRELLCFFDDRIELEIECTAQS